MLEEQVQVTAVHGDIAWVVADGSSGCGGCGQTCSSAALSRYLGQRRRPLAAHCRVAVEPGDRVVVGMDESALLWGSAVVYVLPLLGLLAGAGMGAAWGGASEWLSLLGGVAGFFITLAFAKHLPWLNSAALRPVVLRKLRY